MFKILAGVILVVALVLIGPQIYISVSKNLKESKDKAPKISFNGKTLWLNDSFRFNPTDNCIGNLGATLTAINQTDINIKITEQESFDSKFFPVTPARIVTVENGTCVESITKCENQSLKYCFVVDTKTNPVSYTFETQ
jgi:hypothetical protein